MYVHLGFKPEASAEHGKRVMQTAGSSICVHGGMTENDKKWPQGQSPKKECVFVIAQSQSGLFSFVSVLFCLFDFVCSIFIQVGSGTTEGPA